MLGVKLETGLDSQTKLWFQKGGTVWEGSSAAHLQGFRHSVARCEAQGTLAVKAEGQSGALGLRNMI